MSSIFPNSLNALYPQKKGGERRKVFQSIAFNILTYYITHMQKQYHTRTQNQIIFFTYISRRDRVRLSHVFTPAPCHLKFQYTFPESSLQKIYSSLYFPLFSDNYLIILFSGIIYFFRKILQFLKTNFFSPLCLFSN